jgi:murein DD-endopeptidase MepM/ murein hydrolase activator NlpD
MTRTLVSIMAALALLTAGVAHADAFRLRWPLRPEPVVTRQFDAPRPNWKPGHRGVDLAGFDGQVVYAAGPAVVVFAGLLAGRPLVSLEHDGGLRTTYEPVDAGVRPGQRVVAATPIGTLRPGHQGCGVPVCLHWGAMWGPSSRADYVDPLGLLAATRVRLKPLGG